VIVIGIFRYWIRSVAECDRRSQPFIRITWYLPHHSQGWRGCESREL